MYQKFDSMSYIIKNLNTIYIKYRKLHMVKWYTEFKNLFLCKLSSKCYHVLSDKSINQVNLENKPTA
jgi:hypothetical protein